MVLTLPLTLVLAHFLGDWFFQNDWMALGKSKERLPLFTHVGIWSLFMLPWGWKFAVLSFVFHLVTDCITSQWTSKLWFMDPIKYNADVAGNLMWVMKDPNPRHWFFVAIGFDQLIHYVTLAWTLKQLGL